MFARNLNADFYEYSYLGMRSDDLLFDLEEESLKNKIQQADIIIINIGANDLLDLLDYADLSKVGIQIEYGNIPTVDLNSESIKNLKTYLQEFVTVELKPLSDKSIEDFSIVFPSIIDQIKEYNSNAMIIVNNLYNPFFSISVPLLGVDLSDIEKETDRIINGYNEIINKYGGYKIIDVYSALRDNKYLNVSPLSLSFDPHPNIEGHKKIYELYLQELCYKVTYDNKEYYVLKNGKANIKPKYKFGYTFIKWDQDIDNVKSDIVLKAVYKLNYIYIIIPILVAIAILIVKKKH